MVKLEVSAPLEGPQRTTGQIMAAIPKRIQPNPDPNTGEYREPFGIIEFTVGNLGGTIRDILGSATLKVGLACDHVSTQTALGRLAQDVIAWDGESDLDTDLFIGVEIEFLVEQVGDFWNIDRKSLGPVGHLADFGPQE